jgi:hypothetical protein
MQNLLGNYHTPASFQQYFQGFNYSWMREEHVF